MRYHFACGSKPVSFDPLGVMIAARDTTWWSGWIREDVTHVHNCVANTLEDVGVIFHGDSDGTACWFLAITWTATEDDVANGEAPEVGDILSATEVRILHCPFCGSKLVAGG